VLCSIVILVLFTFPATANTLVDAWAGVQQSLGSTGNNEKLAPALRHLLAEKHGLGLSRISAFSSVLTYAAQIEEDPKIQRLLLRSAIEMDPLLPTPRFISSRQYWENGAYVEALGEFSTGLLNIVRDLDTRRLLVASLVPWLLLTMALAIAMTMLIFSLRFVRLIAGDALFLSQKIFSRVNAAVLAIVILLLPLCAGMGPAWELVYLFVLSWSYIKIREHVAGVLMLAFLVVLMPALNIWQHSMLGEIPLAQRVTEVLEMRLGDFSSLRAFSEISRELENSAAYHVVSGELFRIHGDRELARIDFEKAAILAPNTTLPRLYLGAMALEDRDIGRALEHLNNAVTKDPKNILAHYDLAIALDLTRRFEEGDKARHRARDLSGGHYEKIGLAGREENVLYPKLGRRMVARVVDDARGLVRSHLEGGKRIRVEMAFFSEPSSIVGLFGLIFGTIVFLVRLKYFPPGRECTKCGKVFHPDDKTVYCEQCVTVFLKRNAVSISQQAAKVSQVRQWELLSSISRRLAGILCPGGSLTASGRCVGGLFVSFIVLLPLLGALIWIPYFAREIELQVPWLVFQSILALFGTGIWVSLAVSAWYRR